MKTKPVKHKTENTFRFQTFSERLSNINVDVIHRVRLTKNVPFEAETFLQESVNKWSELNCTEDFDCLKKEVGVEIESLPQLVLQKDAISQALKNQLSKKDNKALDATLEMTVALARDLQYDFYPYFPDFFHLICGHLNTQDPELLERIFTCLAYLYKFLWRYMVKDMDLIFRLYVPLLGDHQKDYVRDFAAESFAFLMRKVPDKEQLVGLIFKHLETSPRYTAGIGKLFFEMTKGVKGQLHSCTETVLPLLLQSGLDGTLGCQAFNRQALHYTFVAMAAHLGGQHVHRNTTIVWKCFQDIVTRLVAALNGNDKGDSTKSVHLENVLSLLHIWVTHENGSLIGEADIVAKILESMIGQPELTPSGTEQLLDSVCLFIKSKYGSLQPGSSSHMISLMYTSGYTADTVLTFTQNMVDFPAFEKDVLPQLLQYCSHLEEKSVAVALLAEVILRRKPLCLSGEDIQQWTPMPLDFASRFINSEAKQQGAVTLLTQAIASFLSLDVGDTSSLPLLWAALTCLPHFRSLQNEEVKKSLSVLITSICKCLYSEPAQQAASAYSFLFFQAVLAAVHCKLSGALTVLTFSDFKELLRLHKEDVHLLRATDIYLMHMEQTDRELLSPSLLEEFYRVLEDHLASPYSLIRLACLRIICHFHPPLPEVKDDDIVQTSIFKIMLRAERVPNTVQEYREKLKHLQKLNAGAVEANTPVGPYGMAPLKYILGTLFINFQVLWKPVQEILVTHSTEDKFWVVFFGHLRRVSATIVNYRPLQDYTFEPSDCDNQNLAVVAFSEALQTASELKENPDYVNHRHLLWGAMEQMATAERRNKDIVALFYQFLEQEFWPNTLVAPYHNVQKPEDEPELPEAAEGSHLQVPNDPSVILIEQEEMEDEEIDDDDLMREPEDGQKKEQHVKSQLECVENAKQGNLAPRAKSKLIRSLCDHLSVFAKFSNPKAVSRSEELHELYLDLLMFRDSDVQKLAFNCLLTYKHKSLDTYKENFQRLLDEKTFRSEIVLFRVDAEGGAVEEDHRKELLPVLMRVLHGKMHMQSGSNTGGKHRFTDKQGIVLRFLASCKEAEIQAFIDLELTTLKEYQQCESPLEMVKQIKALLDVSKIVPIRRLHGMLTTVESMLKYLGGVIPNLLSVLLKLVLVAVAYADTLLHHKDKVVRSILATTRLLRSRGVHLLGWFFHKFDRYEFKSDEIEAVFEAAVWPLLPFLESGSKLRPSPLLRFFRTISRNPRYFVLFSKFKADDPTITPLPPIISLLSNTSLPPGVLKLLLSLINNLLSSEERDASESEDEAALPPPKPITTSSCLELKDQGSDEHGEVMLGRLLLMPYVPHVIKRLKLVVETAIKAKKTVSAIEMNILSMISKYLTIPLQCSELAKLFITGFKKLRSTAPDAEQQKLATILNLIKTADHPEEVVRSLASHFATLSNRQSRQLLTDIYGIIGTRVPEYQQLATFVQKVNAWNPRFAEEADYETRLDGFKLGVKIVEDSRSSPDVATILAIIYNCTYAMRTASDLSLRDSASHALSQMVQTFALWLEEHRDAYRTCVTEALLAEVKRGLCSKTEANRHEFVHILSVLLQYCGEPPVLASLKKLCHQDGEVDFWQNICHIQMHRRARALRRLSSLLRSGELQLRQRTLIDIILPLASSFLLNESYAKHGGLVEAAIDVVSAVSSLLPWRGYEHLLSHYLRLLQRESEHHSTVVRLVVGILDSFHFDLSKSRGLGKDAKQDQQMAPADDTLEEDGANDADSDVEVIDLDKDEPPVPETDMLNEDAATAIHTTIATKLLPRLHRALTEKAKSDDEHKSMRSGLPEESEVLRIPVAVAMVKLLQVLPHGMLQRHLPGILLKICQFLRSRLVSIRGSARETLLKVMACLGPAYFGYLLQEMRATLQRGYQVHVMMYTAHAVLASLADKMKPGDLDSCFRDIIEVCQTELFTEVSEEKDVAQITGKIKEARATKSYGIYKILATVTTENTLPLLTEALQSVLLTSVSHKVVKKCEESLHRIVNGLAVNSTLSVEKLLIHVYSLVNESSAAINPVTKKKPVSEPRLLSEREDVFLLPQEPSRDGLPVKTSRRTNTHIIVEFGLKVLHTLLKREKLSPSEKKHLEMLDPFVPLLTDFVESSYIKIVITSLRCFVRLLRMELPSLKASVPKLAQSLFVLLHKYAGAGMKQGDNFELLVLSFKVITILLKEPDLYTADNKQLVVLLGYVERDLYDHSRQSAAFALLKAVLSHKIDTEELHELMEKVAKMAITEEKEHVRSQCREAYLQYVLDYPMKKRMRTAVGFFVAQLNYGIESGRASALEMLNAYSAHFPPTTLEHYAGTLFVAMAARLVNDVAPNMRRLSSAGIKSLLVKLNNNSRSSLFAIVISWMKSKMFAMLRLAAQVIGIFAEIEKEKFERFLPDLLPLVVHHMKPERFQEFTVEDIERTKDHIAYQLLVSLAKMALACNVVRNPLYHEQSGKIIEYTLELLLHPHAWVRLAAAQLFGAIFASYNSSEIVDACQKESASQEYLLQDCANKVRDLTEKFCSQFKASEIVPELAEQAVKNLVFVAKVSWRLTRDSTGDGPGRVHSLGWILKKVESEARLEVSAGTGATLKRTSVFKFMAAIALDLPREELIKHLQVILRPICRELEDKSPRQDESLKSLAKEVTAILKKVAGAETFSSTLVKLQAELSGKKLKRKRDKAIEAVSNPEVSAKRKMKWQVAKSASQKRKLAEKRGKSVKKRKT